MRPKPTPPKTPKPNPSIVPYRGWNIHTDSNTIYVFHGEDGHELWDSGFPTIEAAKAAIDETID